MGAARSNQPSSVKGIAWVGAAAHHDSGFGQCDPRLPLTESETCPRLLEELRADLAPTSTFLGGRPQACSFTWRRDPLRNRHGKLDISNSLSKTQGRIHRRDDLLLSSRALSSAIRERPSGRGRWRACPLDRLPGGRSTLMSSRAPRAAAPRARSIVRHDRSHGHLNAGGHRRVFS